MKQVYYKGLIGIDAKRFIACIFLLDDPTNPDPVEHVELILLADGEVHHFIHPDDYERLVTHQKIIPELEYRLLGLMSKLVNEIFLSGYYKSYPHKDVCNVVINSIHREIDEYRKENKL